MGTQSWYHAGMTNLHHNHEDEHFPCSCHRPEYAYTDSLCPACEEEREREREAKQEIRENLESEADMQAFCDAAGQMTREDWDADNDWLASAGWGEM